MEESENYPILMCNKSLTPAFENFQKIVITSDVFTLGRGLKNSMVIPFLAISRNHCTFRKTNNDWVIEDHSTFGIEVNKVKLGKGAKRVLAHDDIITLEPSEEFVYRFVDCTNYDFAVPRKKMRMEKGYNDHILNDVKMKFEESQSYEIRHIEDKIQNAKQMQTTSKILKEQLQLDMNRRIHQLESEFAVQIESLQGEKNEVERQKSLLTEERDLQLATVKKEMEGQISQLMEQIQKHNENETELLNENNLLKEKLMKEREDFLSELNRESSSKQDMLEKLEAKVREQEEIRLQEKQQLEEMLRRETEQLRLAKEKELKELEEQKKLREMELEQELSNIKKNLQNQVEETEQLRLKAMQQLNEQMEEMKKCNNAEKVKIEELKHERNEMEKKFSEAQMLAEKSLQDLKDRVTKRETELAVLAADRIQKQAEQSSEVISTLQQQLENVQKRLESVESEKNILLENICQPEAEVQSSTKQSTLTEVGELMESELQCSICAELFVAATTLNCSHTFCKYCITMWKKKKKDCPICRAPITSECKSLVLDTFIEKMVQNLTEEMKQKRQDILKYREELELELAQNSAGTSRGGYGYDESDSEEDESEYLGGEEEEGDDYEDFYDDYVWRPFTGGSYSEPEASDSSNSGSDDSPAHAATATHTTIPDSTVAERRASRNVGVRRRGRVAGREGAYYGGYGRCFNCGARGHWAPGCPF